MKEQIKRIFNKLFKPLVKKLGYVESGIVVKRNINKELLFNFFTILNEINYEPKHIIDVGANHGAWTRETLNHFPKAYYSLFEPQYWLQDSIQDIISVNSKVSFNAYGVGKERGTFKFTIHERDDSCSFKYTEDEAKKKGFKQIDLPVITLDEFIDEKKLPIPDLVKIDAEGLDLEVLAGASSFFGKTEIFMVEASVNNKDYDNTFLKTINYMNDKGYKLFDVTALNKPYKPNILWLVELVFIKKDGIVDNLNYL